MNTISWSSPTTPLPMEINPRVVFERLFGEPGTAAQRAARMRARSQHPRFRSPRKPTPCSAGSARAIARGSASISTTSARSSGASSAPRRTTAREVTTVDAPIGDPGVVRRARRADVRPAGGGLSGGPDARLHVHVSRELSQRTYPQIGVHRAAPLGLAPRQRSRQDREDRQDQHLSRRRCSPSSSRSCDRRPTATARCSITR